MPGIITVRDSYGDVAVGFFFADLELSMNLWAVIAGISGFDGY